MDIGAVRLERSGFGGDSTFSVVAPTESCASTRTTLFWFTRTLVATKARKPSLVTSMVYVPGVMVEIVYLPWIVGDRGASFVRLRRVALTVAPTMARRWRR